MLTWRPTLLLHDKWHLLQPDLVQRAAVVCSVFLQHADLAPHTAIAQHVLHSAAR